MRLVTLGSTVRTLMVSIALVVACGDDSAVGSLSGGPATTEGGSDPGSSGDVQTTMSPDSSGDGSATAGTTTSGTSTGTTTSSSDTTDVTTAAGCGDDNECDDENACTVDTCDGSRCAFEPLDGVPSPDQTENDCQTVMCVAGEAVAQNDDQDFPEDRNGCTEDICTDGVPSHTNTMAGVSCNGNGVCDGEGTCSECISPDDCNQLPPDDDCQTRTCEDNACEQEFALQGAFVNDALQTIGDCRRLVCDGSGGTELADDDTDVPVDGLECTADECNGGVGSNPPLPAGDACTAGLCDGAGGCVGCLVPADCGGTDTFCQTITCVDNVCGVSNTAEGTVLPGIDQTAADCQELQCDGAGAAQPVPDDDDVPVDDGNDCTDEICLGGLPFHPDLPLDTTCDDDGGFVCNGAGDCVECNDDTQCSLSDQCDVPACNNNTCGMEPEPLGTACDDQLFCTFSDTCNGNGLCIGAGDPCPGADSDGDCSESCSEQFDACVGNDANGATCDDGLFCTATDTCDGNGTCNGGGNPCAGADGDSNCAESCNEAANNCLANDPGGSACNDGLFCTATDTCNGLGVCGGTGSPCAGPDGDSNCMESCNEVNNNCTAADPVGVACNDGAFCTLVDVCSAGGVCGGSGNPCSGPDGDFDCSETCNENTNNCTGIDPNGSACSDNVFCNGADSCSNGNCIPSNVNPCPGADGDADCSEGCAEATDTCTANDPNNSVCSDGLFCTGVDHCNNAGLCIVGTNPCPGADGDADCSEMCSEAADACTGNDPNNSACNDGQFCTETDRCNGAGTCVGSGSPCDGSDNDTDCTEQCVEASDSCNGQDPNNTVCDDDCGLCEGGACVTFCF